MMSNYVFPEVSMSKLTCFYCENPLSRFPIYITEKGPLCNRCREIHPRYWCKIYEEIAKNIEFPCCYKQNGCPENLLPENMKNHELYCKFKTFICPFECSDRWKGFLYEFLEHTTKKHPTRVFTDECCFKVVFKKTHKIKLMPYLDSVYVIRYFCSGANGILLIAVKQFLNELANDNLNFKITFEDSKKQFSHTVFVDLNATLTIKKFELDNLLGNSDEVLATIEVLQDQPVDVSVRRNVNNELLRHFECIVCMDYMIGPIYLCTKGHSICQSCRDQVTTCPMCRSQIQTTRNYTLEGLASDFEFPCKSDKCMFVGKGTVIKKHQETCNFIEKDCPLKELYGCKKKFVYADLSDHIFKEHNKHWYEGEVISYPFEFDEEYEKVLFLKYCSKLFRLNFSYKIGSFTYVAKLIDGSEESSNYSFVVDILDTTGNKNRLCYSKNLKAKEQTIQIPFAFIEHLIHLVFNFRMSVLEN